jgi:hypothetical protein
MSSVIPGFGFIGEGGGGSGSWEKSGSSHPNGSPVPTSTAQHSSPATDSRHHLITPRDQVHSVLRSNPGRENVVFGGKRRLGTLTDQLVGSVCLQWVHASFLH